MREFFLFSRAPSPEWTRRKTALYWAWNVLCLLAAAGCLGLCSLFFAKGIFPRAMFWSYLKNPWILALNTLPVALLAVFLWALTARAWIAFLSTSVVTMALTWVSYFKLTFRNDPLLFEDIFLIKEAGNMAGKYSLFVTGGMLAALVLIAGGTVFLALTVRARPCRWTRAGVAAAALLAALPLRAQIISPDVYQNKTANNDLISIWSATDVYISKGFIYPFLKSAADTGEAVPASYTPGRAQTMLAAYEDADIPEDKKVSIIAIQLEAFQDFTRFSTPELAYDLYAPYHALEAEGYSGNLLTNIFAGGTVDTERAVLTGFHSAGSLRARTNSYAWYFRTQGYAAEGMHPCYAWFYNRANINENLGFENYWFVENYYAPLTDGGVGFDGVFFPELIKSYEANKETGKPLFSFNVTYQGHGPYNEEICWWGELGDFVKQGAYTEPEQYILDNYFGSIANTIEHIEYLANYLRKQDDPVILVLFGDHNPWMGDGNSVYDAIGLNINRADEQGFRNYYTTRYLIWGNDAAKEALGRDLQGEGPDIGPYFLMNELFALCGWSGPAYLQATNQIAGRVPMLHATGPYLENGRITTELSPEGAALVEDYLIMEYEWRRSFAYQ